MERAETLQILEDVNKILDSMSDRERFNYMIVNSESYRNYIYDVLEYLREHQK